MKIKLKLIDIKICYNSSKDLSYRDAQIGWKGNMDLIVISNNEEARRCWIKQYMPCRRDIHRPRYQCIATSVQSVTFLEYCNMLGSIPVSDRYWFPR